MALDPFQDVPDKKMGGHENPGVLRERQGAKMVRGPKGQERKAPCQVFAFRVVYKRNGFDRITGST